MSADMHIHILDAPHYEIDKLVVCRFLSDGLVDDQWGADYDMVADTPSIWVGEVSWLKAALFEDAGHYVPTAVEVVSEIIGKDFPIIDADLIMQIDRALHSSHSTTYEVAQPDKVIQFLNEHKGRRCFTVSW